MQGRSGTEGSGSNRFKWIKNMTIHLDLLEDRVLLDCELWSGSSQGVWMTNRLSNQLVQALAQSADAISVGRVHRIGVEPGNGRQHGSGSMDGATANAHADHLMQQAAIIHARQKTRASQFRPTAEQIEAARDGASLCVNIEVTRSPESLFLRFMGHKGDLAAMVLDENTQRAFLDRLGLLYKFARWSTAPFPSWVWAANDRGKSLN
jgi:hypothetical protein